MPRAGDVKVQMLEGLVSEKALSAFAGPYLPAVHLFSRHWLVLSAFFLAGVIVWTLRSLQPNPFSVWLKGLAVLSLIAGFIALLPGSPASQPDAAPLAMVQGAVLFGTAVFLVRWGPALRARSRTERAAEARVRSFKHKERMRG